MVFQLLRKVTGLCWWKLIQGEIKGDADFNRITKELEKHLLEQGKTAATKNASMAFTPVKISA